MIDDDYPPNINIYIYIYWLLLLLAQRKDGTVSLVFDSIVSQDSRQKWRWLGVLCCGACPAFLCRYNGTSSVSRRRGQSVRQNKWVLHIQGSWYSRLSQQGVTTVVFHGHSTEISIGIARVSSSRSWTTPHLTSFGLFHVRTKKRRGPSFTLVVWPSTVLYMPSKHHHQSNSSFYGGDTMTEEHAT